MPDREKPDGSFSQHFVRLKAAALSVAGVVALVGIIMLVCARLIPEGAVRNVVEDVAALVFAIGLIQILFETYLQAHLAEEITARVHVAIEEVELELAPRFTALEGAVQLDRSLRPTGLKSLVRSTVDWNDFLAGSSFITLVPWDLDSWRQQEWRSILELSRTRRIEVDLYLPNTDSPYADALAVRFALNTTQLKETVGVAIAEISEGWRATARLAGSVLRIHTYDQPGGIGFLKTDGSWALMIPPIHGPRPARLPLIALADNGTDVGYREWIDVQLGLLSAQIFDEVEIT